MDVNHHKSSSWELVPGSWTDLSTSAAKLGPSGGSPADPSGWQPRSVCLRRGRAHCWKRPTQGASAREQAPGAQPWSSCPPPASPSPLAPLGLFISTHSHALGCDDHLDSHDGGPLRGPHRGPSTLPHTHHSACSPRTPGKPLATSAGWRPHVCQAPRWAQPPSSRDGRTNQSLHGSTEQMEGPSLLLQLCLPLPAVHATLAPGTQWLCPRSCTRAGPARRPSPHAATPALGFSLCLWDAFPGHGPYPALGWPVSSPNVDPGAPTLVLMADFPTVTTNQHF